jgi:type II secretory pathway predicted ATPase ExeA/cell division septation protein DedD
MKENNSENIAVGHPGVHPFGALENRVYLDFYDLKEPPFSITPDPAFLFLSHTHQSVIDKILHGIRSRMGFTLLTGEVGTGKTTLCRSILDSLDGEAETAYIINPSLSGRELISNILDDFGIKYSPDSSKKVLIEHLNHFLLSIAHTKPVVLIIDDAQTMSIEALEDLRLLSNLETDRAKLLQMVLVGQPELLDFISVPQMRQLRQRVAIQCHLEYLTREEVEGYIPRRLLIAGDKGHVRFTPRAIIKIFKASDGVPRLINKICDYSLTAGYVAEDFTIGPRYVKKALNEIGDLDLKEDFASVGKSWRNKVMNKRLALVSASATTLLIILFSLNYLLVFPMCKYEKDIDLRSALPKETVTVKIESLKQEFNESIPKETPYTENSVPSPFALQLGSFKSLEGVVRAVSFYKEREVEAHWHQLDLGAKGKWYRLFTGQFGTKEEAQKFKADYGLLKSIVLFAPWSVLIDQTGSSEDADHIRSVLRNNHYDSYLAKCEDGSHKVLTGIFIKQERAEKLAQEISDLGILARVISRETVFRSSCVSIP